MVNRSTLQLIDVSFAYDADRLVLKEASVALGMGLTLVVGPNGAGKSTLLRLVAGIERPSVGRILFGEEDLWRQEVKARHRLAYVPEQPDLSPYATVDEILTLVCRLRGEPRSRIAEVLERAGLTGHGDRAGRELSMGQRRRALLAAAWIGSPEFLILDEPLEAMDRAGRDQIVAWVEQQILREGTVLLATHEIEPFVGLVSRVLTIRAGEVTLIDIAEVATSERLALIDALAR